jgi:gamma-tubulin complex component 2
MFPPAPLNRVVAHPFHHRSIKQYFFIDHGDAFTHFLDLAKHEFSKKRKHASESKLQSLLELALRHPSSASASDPFKDDLKVGLGGSTLTEWLVKIVNVSGAFSGEDGVDALGTGMMEEGKKEEQQSVDKTTLHGESSPLCLFLAARS